MTKTTKESGLWNYSQYALRDPGELHRDARSSPSRWVSVQRWSRAAEELAAARAKGKKFPIIFSNALVTGELLGWGILVAVEPEGEGSRYRFESFRAFTRSHMKTELRQHTRKMISANDIRGNRLVGTPKWLEHDSSDDLSLLPITPLPDPEPRLEGRVLRAYRLHRARERALREAKIDENREKNGGRVVCEVPGCGFDFEERYGEIGAGFAEVHHLDPLAERTKPTMTSIQRLIVVCCNCHAMIHRSESEPREPETLIKTHRRV
jgi:hypothetical protein